jgi:ketosteroid isomerase-like protein
MTCVAVGSLLLTPATGADSRKDPTSSPAARSTNTRPGSGAEVAQRAVAALDTEYQRAVKNNDVATMGRILADDFVVIEGDGKVWTKADLLESARNGKTHYEHQEDTEQTVRVWGDTAVLTAKLRAKGLEDGESVDYTEWFSDTYVRTPTGWKYVFGQASLPLPREANRGR